jgi:predicted dehydrogenase
MKHSHSPIRFGFIAAGQIAYHSADAVNSHPEAEVYAVQDLNAERLAALAAEKSIPQTYAKAEELFADAKVDVVYIAVPNKFHAELAIQALRAGKHVILDKPMAMSLAEAESVAEVVEETGQTFMLGMNQRFTPACQKIRALTEAGFFGEIYHSKATWQRRRGIPRLGTWFGNKELAGGGCLYDIGVHLLDLCLYLVNNFEPVSVSGSTYTKFGQRGLGEGGWGKSDRTNTVFDVDDFACALIKFADGSTVDLHVTWACHDREANRMNVQIFGTEAGASSHPLELYQSLPVEGGYQVSTQVDAKIAYPHGDRFHNFINHLRGEEELCVTLQQALTVQKILDGIMESSLTGREVRFDGELEVDATGELADANLNSKALVSAD